MVNTMPTATQPRINVVFVFGGQSSEHEISCLTAMGVLGALDKDRFDACGIGISRDGRWVRYDAAAMAQLKPGSDGQLPQVDPTRRQAVLTRRDQQVVLSTLEGDHLADSESVDVALPLLHGPFGEDGTIQGFFEMLGLPYAGAGVAASAIGMDKQLSKVAFAAAGLNVAPYVTLGALGHTWTAQQGMAAVDEAALEFPVYVKPARCGSSVGITKVDTRDGLPAALMIAAQFDHKVLVEQGVSGREIECAVLGGAGGDTRVSHPGEIVMQVKGGFYDYEAKYLAADDAEVVVPADLPSDVVAAVRAAAALAFAAVDGDGLSRVDSFVLPDGTVVMNEINTMPGFTPISMYPRMWQAEGMSYQALISDLIDQGLARPVWAR